MSLSALGYKAEYWPDQDLRIRVHRCANNSVCKEKEGMHRGQREGMLVGFACIASLHSSSHETIFWAAYLLSLEEMAGWASLQGDIQQ